MHDFSEAIEERELSVRCWQCDWHEQRPFGWFSGRRHLNCPQCESIIVLDCSKMQRELARQRRQLADLRDQIVKLLGEARKRFSLAPGGCSVVSQDPLLDLALAARHPNSLSPSCRGIAAMRRLNNRTASRLD